MDSAIYSNKGEVIPGQGLRMVKCQHTTRTMTRRTYIDLNRSIGGTQRNPFEEGRVGEVVQMMGEQGHLGAEVADSQRSVDRHVWHRKTEVHTKVQGPSAIVGDRSIPGLNRQTPELAQWLGG